jgi:lysophospholipase L1-like esterase
MPSAPPRILALGDSYTIGEGVPAAGRWPALLVQRLRREGMVVADPQLVAVTGWSTDELAAAMDTAEFEPPYALVTLLIGVNNQYRGRDAGNYRTEFHALLARAVALAGAEAGKVVVLSIPDWGVTPFAAGQVRDSTRIAAELDVYNAIGRDEAARAGAHWLDITGISRACGAAPGMLADDGLHPSATQYMLWMQRLLPLAREVLRKPVHS